MRSVAGYVADKDEERGRGETPDWLNKNLKKGNWNGF